MIFEGRALDDISDDELAHLVKSHVSERQHLEFKATFDYRDDEARLEMLRDVVAMANSGGGYLVFGVRDDGRGRAQSFVEPGLMAKSDSMIQSIRALCHEHIGGRIEGIEIRERNVNGNTIVIVRIPVSGRRPHMVTLHRRTEFVMRVEDGKREMSHTEIREAFLNEPISLRLDRMKAQISSIVQMLTESQRKTELMDTSTQPSDAHLHQEDGHLLADAMRKRFEQEIGKTPFLWLGATPVAPRRGLMAVDRPGMAKLFSVLPGSRRDGWNMAGLGHSRQTPTGVQLGTKQYKYLEVIENGHLEFWTPLDAHFCWRQSEEELRARPRLYPYAVVEYPVTFLRLAAALLDSAGYSDEVLVQLEYRNAGGYTLRPGQPDEIRFLAPSFRSVPLAEPHLQIGPIAVSGIHKPDRVAFDLLKEVYRGFGLGVDSIPFWNSNDSFSFE